jgi:hypothetical protein
MINKLKKIPAAFKLATERESNRREVQTEEREERENVKSAFKISGRKSALNKHDRGWESALNKRGTEIFFYPNPH